MFKLWIIIFIAFNIECHLYSTALVERKWSFTIIYIKTQTSDPKLTEWDVRISRVTRSEHVVDGSGIVNFNVTNDTTVECHSYFSSTGIGDYKQLPYSIEKQHILKFMNGFYKDALMESFANCSNLPVIKTKLESIEKKAYYLKNCRFNKDKFPAYISFGFYKLVFKQTNPEWGIEILVQVEKDVS